MANRQTRRKNEKNQKTKKNKEEELIEDTLSSAIIDKILIVLMILCILGLFYLLTVYITTKNSDKEKKDNTETSEATFNYDKIMAGRVFSMNDEDYIVLLYDTSNEEIVNKYSELINNYKNDIEHLPVYYVDMNDPLNKKFSTPNTPNRTPANASELEVNGPTLIRITNGNLADYVEGEEEITNYLS